MGRSRRRCLISGEPRQTLTKDPGQQNAHIPLHETPRRAIPPTVRNRRKKGVFADLVHPILRLFSDDSGHTEQLRRRHTENVQRTHRQLVSASCSAKPLRELHWQHARHARLPTRAANCFASRMGSSPSGSSWTSTSTIPGREIHGRLMGSVAPDQTARPHILRRRLDLVIPEHSASTARSDHPRQIRILHMQQTRSNLHAPPSSIQKATFAIGKPDLAGPPTSLSTSARLPTGRESIPNALSRAPAMSTLRNITPRRKRIRGTARASVARIGFYP